MFKRIFYTLFIFLSLGYTAYSFYNFSLSPCDKPIEYSIGRFDTQFGITKQEFKTQIKHAEEVWEKTLGKDIFVYKEGSNFKINLIYDERQLLIMQKQKGESGLQAAEDILNTLDMQFNEMKKEYDALISAHKSAAASLEERQKSYKSKVDYWNERGGAPKNEYDALRKEAVVLNKEASVLNNEVSVINAKSRELNTLLDQRNKAAAAYNQTVQIYNQKYGQGLEFDQAEYVSGRKNPLIFGRGIGEEINVYEFTNNADLALALAHEFGHALGMNHVENSKSIMYYTSGANTRASFSPSAEDLAELKRVCELK
jgi:hypothetical protein